MTIFRKILCLLFLPVVLVSQDQVFTDFSACDGENTLGDNALLFGDINCECGVDGSCLHFDGVDDYVVFPKIDGEDFASDFTLSFYFWIDDTSSNLPMEIMSIRDTCIRDSVFTVRYFPAINEIAVEFANANIEFSDIQTRMEENRCWHYLSLVKEDGVVFLWLDGEVIDFINVTNINISRNALLTIGRSPCTDLTLEQKFTGRIDEFQFIGTPMLEAEIRASDLFPDRIISSDTTIFTGESVLLETGDICTNNFFWNPTDGLSDDMDTDPVASPSQTTTYVLRIDHGSCITTDSVRISIVSEDDLNCEGLVLPNVFTPNNDNINDNFGISNAFIIDEIITFQVFNKWGALMYETNDKNDQWDGRYKGSLQNTDVYVYKVNYLCNGEEFAVAGNFSLLR